MLPKSSLAQVEKQVEEEFRMTDPIELLSVLGIGRNKLSHRTEIDK